jgi:glycosyltransferase involved in cell wall biosynthesis
VSEPRLRLVIPARNEEAYLPALLTSVVTAAARYPHGLEVVVADNVSTDRTAEVTRPFTRRLGGPLDLQVVSVETRNIAAVRNGGAAGAGGELLAFVDADCVIHPDSFTAIDRALSDRRWIGGTTGLSFDRLSPGIVLAHVLFEPLAWITRMRPGIYFCRRADFVEIGGYDESLPFAEDVQLLADLRRLGRSRAQRLAAPRGVRTITSARKFDRFGEFHYFGLFAQAGRYLLRRDRRGRDGSRVARRTGGPEGPPPPPDARLQDYWYGDRR